MTTRPTRSQLIGAMVTDALLQTRMQWRVYVDAVVRHYHDTIDLEDRVLSLKAATTAAEVEDFARVNTQTIKRMLNGEHRLVSDIEESLIAALPDDWQRRLQAALLQRAGLIYAESPRPVDAPSHMHVPCELMRSTADAIESIEPMLRNHVIGPEDIGYFEAAERGLDLVMGVCLSTRAQIHAARVAAGAPQRGQGVH